MEVRVHRSNRSRIRLSTNYPKHPEMSVSRTGKVVMGFTWLYNTAARKSQKIGQPLRFAHSAGTVIGPRPQEAVSEPNLFWQRSGWNQPNV